MTERREQQSDNQASQKEMIEKAQSLPGIAEVIEVFGRLSGYMQFVNVQPSQVHNATGGNAS